MTGMSDLISRLLDPATRYQDVIAELVPDALDSAEALQRLGQIQVELLPHVIAQDSQTSEDVAHLSNVLEFVNGRIQTWEFAAKQLERNAARFAMRAPQVRFSGSSVRPQTNSPREYVLAFGGDPKRVINRVLIANNGMAAAKSIASFREWCLKNFGNSHAIQIVVPASPEDIQANAEYIRMADEVVEVPGGTNSNNYANVALIVDIAKRNGVDAVWPGWGHASENPLLPRALDEAGIVFVGPSEAPMRALGDKIAANINANSAGVSLIPWSGDGLTVPLEMKGQVPTEIYEKAAVNSLEHCREVIRSIGLPVMIKAAGTGGGKGMRKVFKEVDLEALYAEVVGESQGSSIFIMKVAPPTSRHIEVQVVADQYGNVITLFERDCSMQRKHQKVVEEAPATVVPEPVRLEMRRQAAALAKLVDYQNAGTVEFLYDPDTQQFYFLELNSRLQVEHPATEGVTGLNLPGIQLAIAMGVPLYRIPEIRALYGRDPYGSDLIDFSNPDDIKPDGVVLDVRITAEDTDKGYQPTTGKVTEINFKDNPNVWGYFSVHAPGSVHQLSDAQIGHLFARGRNREEARLNMLAALETLVIKGEIRTNREDLITLLNAPDFIGNKHDISWLDARIAAKVKAEKPDHDLAIVSGALFRAFRTFNENKKQYVSELTRTENVPHSSRLGNVVTLDLIWDDNKYTFKVIRTGEGQFTISMNGSLLEARVTEMTDGGLRLVINGKSYVVHGSESAEGLRIEVDGKSCLFTKEVDPTKVIAQLPGRLVKYLVPDGEHVLAADPAHDMKGTPIAIIESMKMLYTIRATTDGVVHYAQPVGASVSVGDLLMTMQLDDPSAVKLSTPYRSGLRRQEPTLQLGQITSSMIYREMSAGVRRTMDGYALPAELARESIKRTVDTYAQTLADPMRPVFELKEILSGLGMQIPVPAPLAARIRLLLGAFEFEDANEIPWAAIKALIKDHIDSQPKDDQQAVTGLLKSFDEFVTRNLDGLPGQVAAAFNGLLQEYIDIEKLFDGKGPDEIKRTLTAKKMEFGNWDKVYALAHAHNLVDQRKMLIMCLLGHIHALEDITPFKDVLEKLTQLKADDYHEIGQLARQILSVHSRPAFSTRLERMTGKITALAATSGQEHDALLRSIVEEPEAIFDTLTPFLWDTDPARRKAAMELYIQRAYRVYEPDLTRVQIFPEGDFHHAHWAYGFQAGEKPDAIRYGTLAVFDSFEVLHHSLNRFLRRHLDGLEFKSTENNQNTLTLVVKADGMAQTLPAMAAQLQAFLDTQDLLKSSSMSRVTFTIHRNEAFPLYFTFRHDGQKFVEARDMRGVEPPLAYLLEYRAMRNFNLRTFAQSTPGIYVFYGEGRKGETAITLKPDTDRRFFIRTVVRKASVVENPGTETFVMPEVENAFRESLDNLELALKDRNFVGELRQEQLKAKTNGKKEKNTIQTDWNQIFLNILPALEVTPEIVQSVIRNLSRKYADRLKDLRVAEVEVRVNAKAPDVAAVPMRFVASNPTGYELVVHGYREEKVPAGDKTVFVSLDDQVKSPLAGKDVRDGYAVTDETERKRIKLRSKGMTYVYDMPSLFATALKNIWNKAGNAEQAQSASLISATELVLNDQGELVETSREPGGNKIGMVAWRVMLSTPEYPEGRPMILIANDFNHDFGSFSPKEDDLFQKASALARIEGIPRIYIAANSGARIGLAREVMDAYRVQFKAGTQEEEYQYLTEADYERLKDAVQAVRIFHEGEVRYKITTVIGLADGLGVENLRGSGVIAGETSQAYNDTFTLTFVEGPNVGIGSYVTRLGQRVIQKEGSYNNLTGAEALNKIVGRPAYNSHTQLGGTEIMMPNGVSHLKVQNDLEGFEAILKWLSFVPARKGDSLPVLANEDPVDRLVGYTPASKVYDPRHLLTGMTDPVSQEFKTGFLDSGSFVETLPEWGKTIVVGRGRLGGIPVGVIIPETRSFTRVIPADPGDEKSSVREEAQAGTVLYPDSSFKTAQTIADLDREGLPLILFANFRGFSGGTRDMFAEVLKYGSYIVDSLRDFHQPVFIHIPPFGELRGGAWVVVDPTINKRGLVEMTADTNSRGGVLEPSGTVEIKYKKEDLFKKMHQVDDTILELDRRYKATKDAAQQEAIAKQIEAREQDLLPVYAQLAQNFADRQDTPERMLAKGVISGIVPWEQSRTYFAARLKTRMEEHEVAYRLDAAYPGLEAKDRAQYLAEILLLPVEAREAAYAMLASKYREDQMTKLVVQDQPAAVRALVAGLALMDPNKAEVLKAMLEAWILQAPQPETAPTEPGSSGPAVGGGDEVPPPVASDDPKAPSASAAHGRAFAGIKAAGYLHGGARIFTAHALAPQVRVVVPKAKLAPALHRAGIQTGLIRSASLFAQKPPTILGAGNGGLRWMR